MQGIVAACHKDILQCLTLHGIVRHVSALPKDRPRTCSGAHVSWNLWLQVTAISAVKCAVCCKGRKWGRPSQNASMMTASLTVRRQAHVVTLPQSVGHVNRKTMHVLRNNETPSPSNCHCLKTIIIAYRGCVSVVFVIQRAKRTLHIAIYDVPAPPPLHTVANCAAAGETLLSKLYLKLSSS